MYTYPAKFPVNILNVFQQFPKLCRYIDIPLQHISDNVLRSMQRGISKRATKELLKNIRSENSDIAIRTTFIVGYPTETEDDFEELYNFVEEMRFHRLGVFQYSREEGTRAFGLGDPVSPEVKTERQSRLMELQKEISEEHNETTIGKRVKVLIDSRESDFYIGRTEWDAPEIDQEVIVHSHRSLSIGDFYSIVINDAAGYDLFASV